MWSTAYTNYTWRDDEAPPSFGVREPRQPKPPTLTGGAAAAPEYRPDPAPSYREVVTCLTFYP